MAVNDKMFSDLIKKLRACSSVPVIINGDATSSANTIAMSPLKLNDMIRGYQKVHELAHKYWFNLLTPSCDGRAYLLM